MTKDLTSCRCPLVSLVLVVGFLAAAPAGAYSILHTHQSAEKSPQASLILDGSGNLYGTTANGGSAGLGTVFKVNSDGSGFQLLYSFTGGRFMGSYPVASLVLDGRGILHGTTAYGGSADAGIFFALKTDGTGFYLSHNFIGGPSNGSNPHASLILDTSGYLYGTTSYGGPSNAGTIFKATSALNATGFHLLHAFAGYPSDGSNPNASLVQDASEYLYGTTANGGSSNLGTVFRVNSDGTGFQLLHSFTGYASDGDRPFSSLILDSSGNLYGTTLYGGSSGRGTVFKLRTDGTGFQVLHSFLGGASDGQTPLAALILDASGNLYGTTSQGGPSNSGTIFKIKTDGTGFRLLYTFAGYPSDGGEPHSSLILDGSGNLYGTTVGGGSADAGTVFKLKTDGTGFQLLYSFIGDVSDGLNPRASLIPDGSGSFYGTTESGGAAGKGTIFKFRKDGTQFELLHSFTGSESDGDTPYASLILDGSGNLYGTTISGGFSGGGTVFKVKTNGTGFQLLHSFTGLGGGWRPYAPLILGSSGYLYGTTSSGGSSNSGAVFKVKTDGTGFQFLPGGNSHASLILDGSGYLYGTTFTDGPMGYGTVFKVKTDGTGFQILHPFSDCVSSFCTGHSSDPSWPDAPLVLDGSGNLYGTTSYGGSSYVGTIFKIKTDGTGFQFLHTFNGGASDGARPLAAMTLDDSGHIYGTTALGGPSDLGTVFMFNTDGTGFHILHAFAGAPGDGSAPYAPVILDGSGNLYGTTYRGGPSNAGTEFTLATDSTKLSLQGGKVSVQVTWKSQYSGQSGTANAISKANQYGYFFFSEPDNPELFVKVLDFGANQPYLLFWGGLTDFEYTITFTNTATGASVSFSKPAGSTAGGSSTTDLSHVRAVLWDTSTNVTSPLSQDTSIAEAVMEGVRMRRHKETTRRTLLIERAQKDAGPAADSEILLANGQVAVSVTWRSQYTGQTGTAIPIPQKDEFCFFYFSDQENPEVFVKVLDWGSQSPFKIFAAGLTDYEYSVTFRNVTTGASVVFKKLAGAYDGYAADMDRAITGR